MDSDSLTSRPVLSLIPKCVQKNVPLLPQSIFLLDTIRVRVRVRNRWRDNMTSHQLILCVVSHQTDQNREGTLKTYKHTQTHIHTHTSRFSDVTKKYSLGFYEILVWSCIFSVQETQDSRLNMSHFTLIIHVRYFVYYNERLILCNVYKKKDKWLLCI